MQGKSKVIEGTLAELRARWPAELQRPAERPGFIRGPGELLINGRSLGQVVNCRCFVRQIRVTPEELALLRRMFGIGG